jgi:membrane protein required for colicin V production|tara:strand:+ start:6317 stop:6892 length:576 start_codon:yes stop_codon:yes gene_type:complete
MSDLTAFDIFFFAVLAIFAVLGIMRGFVTEILGLLAWVAGVVAVNLFFDRGRELALGFVDDPTTAAVISVIVIFIGAFAIMRLIAKILGTRVRNSVIGPIDRVLGFGFGAMKGLLLATFAWMLLELAFDMVPGDERPEWLAQARSGPLLGVLGHEVQDFVATRRESAAIEDAEGYSDQERDALDALLEAAQ